MVPTFALNDAAEVSKCRNRGTSANPHSGLAASHEKVRVATMLHIVDFYRRRLNLPSALYHRFRTCRSAAGVAVVFMAGVVAAATAGKAEPLQLSLPVACEPGRTCFVQSFVDVDPGPGVRDWRCGAATYDGHTGLDIRVLSAAATTAGVAVVAAASGIVRTTRDGMSESLLTGARRADLMTRGCGNAVVIDHANGWQTTYCHLKPGSVRVRSAQKVERG